MKSSTGIGALGAMKVGDSAQFPPRPGHGTAGKPSTFPVRALSC